MTRTPLLWGQWMPLLLACCASPTALLLGSAGSAPAGLPRGAGSQAQAQAPIAPPSPAQLALGARSELKIGHLERSSLLFEQALESGGDRSELLAVLSELGDSERLAKWAQRVLGDVRATPAERAAATSALGAAPDTATPEQLLAQGLKLEKNEPAAAHRNFDRARIAFERRDRARARLDLEYVPAGDLYFAEDSRSFAVVRADGYQSWNLAEHRLERSVPFSAALPIRASANLHWFADAHQLFDSNGGTQFTYDEAQVLAFSPDSAELYTVEDHATRLWAVPSGQLLGTWPRGAFGISWCGKQLLVDTGDAAELRASFAGPALRSFPHVHLWPGVSGCVGADKVVTGGPRDSLKFYEQKTGRMLKSFDELSYNSFEDIVALSLSSGGGLLVTPALSRGPAVVDTRTWSIVYGSPAEQSLGADPERGSVAAVSPNGQTLVEAVNDARLRIRALPSGRVSWEAPASAGRFSVAEASPDGSMVAALGSSSVVLLTPGASKTSALISEPFVLDVKWLSAHELAILAPGVLRIVDEPSGRVQKALILKQLADNSRMHLLVGPNHLSIVDQRARNMLVFDREVSAAPRTVNGTFWAVSDSGNALLSFDADKLALHDRDGKQVRIVSNLAGEVWSKATPRFTSDDRFLIRTTSDAAVLWNLATDREERRFAGAAHLTNAAFSTDRAEFGTLSEDDTIRVFSVATGAVLRQFSANQDAGKDAAWLGRSGWRLRERKLSLWSSDGRAVLQLVSDRAGFAGYLQAPDGRIESLDSNQPKPVCAIATGRYPWQLCEGRLAAQDLLSSTLQPQANRERSP